MSLLHPSNGRRGRDDAAFTLIELTVVIVVIGVLIAVAIPTFLGSRDKASDTAAKSRAQQVAKTQLVHASDAEQEFAKADEVAAEDPSVRTEPYEGGEVPTQVKGVVYVKDPAGGIVTLVARSATGTCFWTRVQGGTTSYATNDCSDEPDEFESSW